jgi:PAS domain S-box-containing protein
MASNTAEKQQTRYVAPALLASIVDSSDDAIISKTLEGEITSWNAAAERRYGCSAGEIVGKSITLLIVEGSDEMVEILAKIREGERVEHHRFARNSSANDGRSDRFFSDQINSVRR